MPLQGHCLVNQYLFWVRPGTDIDGSPGRSGVQSLAATMSPDARIHLATRIATPPEYNIAMQGTTKASAWKKAEKVYGTTADAVLRQ